MSGVNAGNPPCRHPEWQPETLPADPVLRATGLRQPVRRTFRPADHP